MAEIIALHTLPMTFLIARRCFALSICAAALSASASDDEDYSKRLAALVNQYRVSQGIPAMQVDSRVSGLAREHSAAMAKAGRLSHDGFPSRVQRSGVAMCVENVGSNYGSPKEQFDAWRASPGHDRNMLDRRVDRMGVGMVADYVTLVACGK
ncbi:MAG: CAP domain-containing protein [Casimicrobiaceae bacterium]